MTTCIVPKRDAMLPDAVAELCRTAEQVCADVVAPRAEQVDEEARWPEHSMDAFADAGLLGLLVPCRLGGHEQGLLALTTLCEVIGRSCSSSALCFGMHNVGTAVIAAKPTAEQEEQFLIPIAAGNHVTTLALSEPGTGSEFYYPETVLEEAGDSYLIRGEKCFVTNGGHADSYVVSTMGLDDEAHAGEFSCVLVERTREGLRWGSPWAGLGMRGNQSRALSLDNVRVPARNLLGMHGDQVWYVFEIVAPYFLLAMAGTYLGLAEAALGECVDDLERRTFSHSGRALRDEAVIQTQLAEAWLEVARTRATVHHAATLGDTGDPQALIHILATKVAAAECAVSVTNQAMSLCGGRAFRANSRLARLLRDARASHVMAPTTNDLKRWIGRSLLDLPLL